MPDRLKSTSTNQGAVKKDKTTLESASQPATSKPAAASPTPGPSRNRRGERTVHRILDAAEDAFAQYGYKAANLRDIAAAVGIQQPGLYKHFDSKEALYAAVLSRALKPLLDRLEALTALGGAFDRFNLPAQIMDVQAMRPNAASLIYQALLLKGDDAGREFVLEWMDVLLERGFELTHKLHPELRKNDILLIALALMNLEHGFFLTAPVMSRVFGKPELSPELMVMWKTVLVRVYQALITNPPPALPLKDEKVRG